MKIFNWQLGLGYACVVTAAYGLLFGPISTFPPLVVIGSVLIYMSTRKPKKVPVKVSEVKVIA